MDHRSPWILFDERGRLEGAAELQVLPNGLPHPEELRPDRAQQGAGVHRQRTRRDDLRPEVHGAYDDRPLEPGDLTELDAIIHDSPWTEDRMEKVYDKLYDGCREHAEARSDLHKEPALAEGAAWSGKPSPG